MDSTLVDAHIMTYERAANLCKSSETVMDNLQATQRVAKMKEVNGAQQYEWA